MKAIKLIKDCTYGDKYLFKNDIIEPNRNNLEMIKELNTKGFIEPLTLKDIQEIEKNVNRDKKEEVKNARIS